MRCYCGGYPFRVSEVDRVKVVLDRPGSVTSEPVKLSNFGLIGWVVKVYEKGVQYKVLRKVGNSGGVTQGGVTQGGAPSTERHTEGYQMITQGALQTMTRKFSNIFMPNEIKETWFVDPGQYVIQLESISSERVSATATLEVLMENKKMMPSLPEMDTGKRRHFLDDDFDDYFFA